MDDRNTKRRGWHLLVAKVVGASVPLLLTGIAYGQSPGQACTTAKTLSCGGSYKNENTSGSLNGSAQIGCSMGIGLWYVFTPTTNQCATVTVTPAATSDPELGVAKGSCGALTNLACVDAKGSGGTESYSFLANAGTSYYFYVGHWQSGSTTAITYNISLTCTPASPTGADYTYTAPFTHSATTCGKANDVTSNSCNSSYAGGEDVIYAISFPSPGTYRITVTNTDNTNYIGWFLTNSSPRGTCGSISSCIDYAVSGSSSTASKCVTISTAGTYYLTIDYWPSPTCSNYSISVQSVTPGLGDNCTSPIVLSGTSGSYTFNTSCGYMDNYQGSCASSTSPDIVFRIDVPAGQTLRWQMTNDNFDMVNYAYVGSCKAANQIVCYDIPDDQVNCWTNTSASTQTVYIVADGYGSTNSGTATLDWSIFTSPSTSCSYTITSISYQPPPNGYTGNTAGTAVSFSATSGGSSADDDYNDAWIALPQNFCFYGLWFNQFLTTDNLYMVFPNTYGCGGHVPSPGGFAPWDHTIGSSWPNVNYGPVGAIALAWYDGYFTGNTSPNYSWQIRYQSAPCPAYTGCSGNCFFLKFYEIPSFGCPNDANYNTTGYIMLNPCNYSIEIHVLKHGACTSHDDGLAILGLHSPDGKSAAVPAGYNNTAWSVNSGSPVAFRFTPNAGCCVLPLEPQWKAEILCSDNTATLRISLPPIEYRGKVTISVLALSDMELWGNPVWKELLIKEAYLDRYTELDLPAEVLTNPVVRVELHDSTGRSLGSKNVSVPCQGELSRCVSIRTYGRGGYTTKTLSILSCEPLQRVELFLSDGRKLLSTELNHQTEVSIPLEGALVAPLQWLIVRVTLSNGNIVHGRIFP